MHVARAYWQETKPLRRRISGARVRRWHGPETRELQSDRPGPCGVSDEPAPGPGGNEAFRVSLKNVAPGLAPRRIQKGICPPGLFKAGRTCDVPVDCQVLDQEAHDHPTAPEFAGPVDLDQCLLRYGIPSRQPPFQGTEKRGVHVNLPRKVATLRGESRPSAGCGKQIPAPRLFKRFEVLAHATGQAAPERAIIAAPAAGSRGRVAAVGARVLDRRARRAVLTHGPFLSAQGCNAPVTSTPGASGPTSPAHSSTGNLGAHFPCVFNTCMARADLAEHGAADRGLDP